MDDIIDIFSQPLKSQQKLDASDSSSDDESEAASLTSRSFGDKSDIDESKDDNPGETAPLPDEEPKDLEDEVSVVEVSKQIDTLHFQELGYKSTEEGSPEASGDVRPHAQWIIWDRRALSGL